VKIKVTATDGTKPEGWRKASGTKAGGQGWRERERNWPRIKASEQSEEEKMIK
jgi:hypothetical protein